MGMTKAAKTYTGTHPLTGETITHTTARPIKWATFGRGARSVTGAVLKTVDELPWGHVGYSAAGTFKAACAAGRSTSVYHLEYTAVPMVEQPTEQPVAHANPLPSVDTWATR